MPSKIEWLARPGTVPESWNSIAGCTKVSPGCDNCYALAMSWRIANVEKHPARYDGVVDKSSPLPGLPNGFVHWTGKVNTDDEALDKPYHWSKPRTVFVCSMSDLFHESVPVEFIWQVVETAWRAKDHTFMVLTKHPGRMFDVLTRSMWWLNDTPRNIWLGVTAENQKWADERIPVLLEIPATVRFVSLEPLLGPITVHYHFRGLGRFMSSAALDWVIVGGESGPHARVMDESWAEDIVEQCQAAKVPVFVKQMGTVWAREVGCRDGNDPGYKGQAMRCWPRKLQVREWPR